MLTNPLYTVLVAMLCISIDAFSTPSRIQKETHISMKSKDNIFRIPAIIGTAIALMSPLDVNAVPSGSRRGGSSFRSAPSSRSSTSLRSSMPTRSYSSGPSINIMPSYGYGYGFGGFGMSPFSPFSYIPINFNVVLLAGIAYAVYTVVSSGIGGSSSFSSDNDDYGVLGSGASVLKLSVAVDSDWNKPGNIMDSLALLASRSSSMAGRKDLSNLLSEASLTLLRQQNQWTACSYSNEVFSQGNMRSAEPAFQKLAIAERTKFDSEDSPSTVAMIREAANNNGAPTAVVVSLVVAFRGKSSAISKSVRSTGELKSCLQSLAADALSDEGDNVMAVEVLWTPSQRGSILSQRDLIVDYPELIRL